MPNGTERIQVIGQCRIKCSNRPPNNISTIIIIIHNYRYKYAKL